MKYKEFKQTDEYNMADVVELFSEETGEEFDDSIPEEEFDDMYVVGTSCCGSWLSITLK